VDIEICGNKNELHPKKKNNNCTLVLSAFKSETDTVCYLFGNYPHAHLALRIA